MSLAPPVSKDGFSYAGDLFAQASGHNRHRRAAVAELKDHFKSGSEKDHPAHWFEAQLIHYGLQPSKTKAVARMRLYDAVNGGKLSVPAHIKKVETELKKEWTKNEREAKKALGGAADTPVVKSAKRKAESENVDLTVNVGGINITVSASNSSKKAKMTSKPEPPSKSAKKTTAPKPQTPKAAPSKVTKPKPKAASEPRPKKEPSVAPFSASSARVITAAAPTPTRTRTKQTARCSRGRGSSIAGGPSSRLGASGSNSTPQSFKIEDSDSGSDVVAVSTPMRSIQKARRSRPWTPSTARVPSSRPDAGATKPTPSSFKIEDSDSDSVVAVSAPTRPKQMARRSSGWRGIPKSSHHPRFGDDDNNNNLAPYFKGEDSDSESDGYIGSAPRSSPGFGRSSSSNHPNNVELKPLGLLNGRYAISSDDITSQWGHQDLSLVLTLSGSELWGRFDLGVIEGILKFDRRPYQSSLGAVEFTWRGRELDGPMMYGNDNKGSMFFFGDGRIKGRIDFMGLAFEGYRLPGQGTRSEVDARDMLSEWSGYNEDEFERENRDRWR